MCCTDKLVSVAPLENIKKKKKNTKPTNKQQEGVFTQGGFYSQLPHLQAMTPAKLLKASKGFS